MYQWTCTCSLFRRDNMIGPLRCETISRTYIRTPEKNKCWDFFRVERIVKGGSMTSGCCVVRNSNVVTQSLNVTRS